MEELEIVPQNQVEGMRVFLNRVEYRSPHFHSEWELLWVLDNPLSIVYEQQKLAIEPGEVILFPPNCPHEFHEIEQPCTFLCLQISTKLFVSTENLRTKEVKLSNCLPPETLEWLRQTMAEIAKACWERLPYYGLFCLGQCGLILHKLLQFVPCHVMSKEELSRVEQCNARLSRLLQFVDDNYMHKIRLADFARQEGRTVSYMSHFVRDTMNQTFQEYVNSVRFNHARKLIATTSDPLVNICFESGFSDYRYFSQVFQQVYGMTPAEYRKQYQSVSSEQFLPAKSIHSREMIYSSAELLKILKDFLEKTP